MKINEVYYYYLLGEYKEPFILNILIISLKNDIKNNFDVVIDKTFKHSNIVKYDLLNKTNYNFNENDNIYMYEINDNTNEEYYKYYLMKLFNKNIKINNENIYYEMCGYLDKTTLSIIDYNDINNKNKYKISFNKII